MTNAEKALELRAVDFNCTQCVLTACREYTGLDEHTSLAIAGGIGGGVRCGEICGSIVGTALVLGMCNPFVDSKDFKGKVKIATISKLISKKFEEKFGGLRCEDIKGDGSRCNEMIEYATILAEETIKEFKDK